MLVKKAVKEKTFILSIVIKKATDRGKHPFLILENKPIPSPQKNLCKNP